MPRYHFNVFTDGTEPDREGYECADIYVAQSQAVRMAGEILRDLGRKFWTGGEWRLELTDVEGNQLFVVRFSAEELA